MDFKRNVRLLAGLLVLTSCVLAQPSTSEKGTGRPAGPPVPGTILPEPILERLHLSSEQKRQLDELQKTTQEKLSRILTESQRAELLAMQRRRDGQSAEQSKRTPDDRTSPSRDQKPEESTRNLPDSGIQWFPTLESGVEEAQRTNRPILLVSGTPHCAGVSGMW